VGKLLAVADMSALTPLSLKTQVLRFVATGGFSAIVDYGIYTALHALGLALDPAKAISFVAGTLTAYLINRRWTFGAAPSRSRFVKVMALYALTFVVQVVVFHVVFNALGDNPRTKLIAFVIAQGTATVINFIVQRVWIFRRAGA
jgi:putative flippase GtrA